jgi:hypothetical protein
MAVARTFDCHGWSAGQYDELIRRMDLSGASAPGVLFHWAAVTDDGMRAVDVYESREAADRLAGGLIAPLCSELGLPMPEVTEQAVHAYLQPVSS